MRVVPEGFHLLDMGSSNGVFVLGQKVDDAIVREGDVFSIGDVFVRVLPEDIPKTLAMSHSDATSIQTSFAPEPTTRGLPRPSPSRLPPAPPPPAWPEPDRPARPDPADSLLASRALAASSIFVGLGLISAAVAARSLLGALSLFVPVLGGLSLIAGLGTLGGRGWARNLHYTLFTLWILSCLLAPFGGVGIAYQIKGEDRPETAKFFALVIVVAATLAMAALMGATLLARFYVAAPLPV